MWRRQALMVQRFSSAYHSIPKGGILVMQVSYRFLIIHGNDDDRWHKVLRESLSPLGELFVKGEEDAMRLVISERYDIAIIDSSAIKNVPLLVARIRAQRPGIQVVVATASPSWSDARNAFQAGAADYINKSFDKRRDSFSC